MKRQFKVIARTTKLLDKISGMCLLAVMAMVVINVFTNGLFNKPILGTYEYVGILTASAIGLSLAHCAMEKGHIAIELVFNKFSARVQAVIEIITGLLAIAFFGIATWQIGKYAYSMILSGERSPTTMTPVYPFIYIVAIGMLMLCLAVAAGLSEPLKKVIKK